MGYGHLRAAQSVADELEVQVLRADFPPFCNEDDLRRYEAIRRVYEWISRASQSSVFGRSFRTLLEGLTSFPELHPPRDLSAPTFPVRRLKKWIQKGFGKTLVHHVREARTPMLSTFYAPAIAAAEAGLQPTFCLITDTDIHRIWVPLNPQNPPIHYFVPSQRSFRRLCSYGVPEDRIELTGFPLPCELLGGRDLVVLKKNLAARLSRLDPEKNFRKVYQNELGFFLGQTVPEEPTQAPLVTFAVGGAGAQARMVDRFLPNLAEEIRKGKWRLALVAGIREEVREIFLDALKKNKLEDLLGNEIQLIFEKDFLSYYRSFNQVLAQTDVLWTKPSELSFYAALGIPLVFSWPVGHQEKCNRRGIIEAGAGLKQGNPSHAAHWLGDWLKDGTLAAAAWAGFIRLPKFGTYQIADRLRHSL